MSFYAVRDFLPNIFSKLESRFDRASGPGVIVKTGFKKLDELTGGLKPGELVLTSGWRGVGKSAFCHNIAKYTAVDEKLPVAIFSPGLIKEALLQRVISAMSGVSIRRLESGTFEPFKWGETTKSIAEVYDAPLYIDDAQDLNIEGVTKAVSDLVTGYLIELIIIDPTDSLCNTRDIEMTKGILQALKNHALTYQVPPDYHCRSLRCNYQEQAQPFRPAHCRGFAMRWRIQSYLSIVRSRAIRAFRVRRPKS